MPRGDNDPGADAEYEGGAADTVDTADGEE